MLKATTVLAVLLTLAACASARKATRCAPIDPELYLDYGGLYDECTVEKRAHLSFAPRIQYPGAAPMNVACVYGTLRFIVDTLGKPIGQSVEVIAGNDQRYVEAMLGSLAQVRFAPGRVKNRPVHQIVRWESRTPVSQLSSIRTTATSTISC